MFVVSSFHCFVKIHFDVWLIMFVAITILYIKPQMCACFAMKLRIRNLFDNLFQQKEIPNNELVEVVLSSTLN